MKNRSWQEGGHIVKRLDIVIVVILLILSVSPLLLLRDRYGGDGKKTAEIFVDGKLYQTIELEQDTSEKIEIVNGDRTNVIRIENGEVWMESANCFNEYCVRQGKINKTGRSIVCLPNNVYIEITGEKDGEVDDIAR